MAVAPEQLATPGGHQGADDLAAGQLGCQGLCPGRCQGQHQLEILAAAQAPVLGFAELGHGGGQGQCPSLQSGAAAAGRRQGRQGRHQAVTAVTAGHPPGAASWPAGRQGRQGIKAGGRPAVGLDRGGGQFAAH